MCIGSAAPRQPIAPPPPPPAPPQIPQVGGADRASANRSRRRRAGSGRASTILTGPQGLASTEASTTAKSLLGT